MNLENHFTFRNSHGILSITTCNKSLLRCFFHVFFLNFRKLLYSGVYITGSKKVVVR